MSWKPHIVTGVLMIIVGALIIYGGVNIGRTVRDYLGRHSDEYPQYSETTYGCIKARPAFEDLDDHTSPYAVQSDQSQQPPTFYLRYKEELIIIKTTESGNCMLTIEDSSRVDNGHFVFLGAGFGPGSPARSSGGSGGSFFGSK